MKKLYLLLVLAFALSISVYAQDTSSKKMYWGYKIGLNVSNLRVENAADGDWKTGLATGLFFNFKIHDKLSIQPEFLYSSMGAGNAGNDEGSLRLNYFSMPVLARYQLKKKLAAVFGPQIDMLILAKTKNDNNQFTKVTNDYKESSFNLTAGAEYWPVHCFGFSFRYMYGFNNIVPTGTEMKNHGFQLMAAIKF